MNETLFHAINQFAGRFAFFDQIILHMAANELFKAVPLILLIWGLWFLPGADMRARRARLFSGIMASMLALVIARALALLLPHVSRPLHTEGFVMRMPASLEPDVLSGWSAFPSDHAALLFALAATVFTVHRGWGVLALLHALVFGALTRVYLGMHWPADVAMGAAVGAFSVWLLTRFLLPWLLQRDTEPSYDRVPHLFYVLAFFVTYQLGSLFTATRWFASAVASALGM